MNASGTNINLMNEYVRQLKSRRALFTKVQFYAGGILIVYLAGIVAVMVYRGILSLQLNQVESRIDESKNRITQLKPLEMKYYFLHNRLTLIRDFWEERLDTKEVLAHLGSILPESVTIDDVSYSESTRTVEVNTKVKDVFETINWLSILEREVVAKSYGKIAISGLNRIEDGSYTVSITFTIPEAG